MKFSAIAITAVLLTAGCAHETAPVIVTKEVNIAVPVPCTVETKNQRPDLWAREKLWNQLSAAPNVDTKAQMVTAQLLAYMGWLPVVEDAMRGCKMEAQTK